MQAEVVFLLRTSPTFEVHRLMKESLNFSNTSYANTCKICKPWPAEVVIKKYAYFSLEVHYKIGKL
jgi:hypothetical protein